MHRSIHSARTSLAVLALAGGLACAQLARADEAEGRAHFGKAQTAYKLGQYEEAIREYEAAYRAMPEPAFLFNIAQAHRLQYSMDKKASHLHQALSVYKAYLRDVPKASNRAQVEKTVEELKTQIAGLPPEPGPGPKAEAKPGVLVLRGENAAGAAVTLDGKALGVMPLSAEVRAGAHQLQVKRPGYAVWSTVVTVADGSRIEVPVELRPLETAPAPTQVSSSKPFYKTWWFWTIAGAVVIAGAGAGTYVAVRGERVPEMPQVDLR